MSCEFLPVALTVAPKSSAMRVGLVIEKPIGSLAGAFFMAMLTTTFEPCWLAVIDSIALSCAIAARAGQRQDQHCAEAYHRAHQGGGAVHFECDHFLVSLLSCNSSFDRRSTHSPPAS